MDVKIEFGFLSQSFVKQLRAQKVRIKSVRHVELCDADNLALSRLTVRHIITERQRDQGRVKLMKLLLAQCKCPPTPEGKL